jgi:hypothetical protein
MDIGMSTCATIDSIILSAVTCESFLLPHPHALRTQWQHVACDRWLWLLLFPTDASGIPLVKVTELSANRSVKTIFVNCTTVCRYNLHTSIQIFKAKLWNKNFFK